MQDNTRGPNEGCTWSRGNHRGLRTQALEWQEGNGGPCSHRRMWLVCWNTSVGRQRGETLSLRNRWGTAGLGDKEPSLMGSFPCWAEGISGENRGTHNEISRVLPGSEMSGKHGKFQVLWYMDDSTPARPPPTCYCHSSPPSSRYPFTPCANLQTLFLVYFTIKGKAGTHQSMSINLGTRR